MAFLTSAQVSCDKCYNEISLYKDFGREPDTNNLQYIAW